ncbi:MAG: hypothetical protein ACREKS_19035 [Candidatus Rokuibacteriota bacterium]
MAKMLGHTTLTMLMTRYFAMCRTSRGVMEWSLIGSSVGAAL